MTVSLLNKLLKYPYNFLTKKDLGRDTLMQTALWVAMLSVIFERADSFSHFWIGEEFYSELVLALMVGALLTYLYRPLRYISTSVFSIGLLLLTIDNWSMQANHSWLAFWFMAPLVFFPHWWENVSYITYTRITLGVVMLAAGAQKIVTHTYLDGSYITYLSYYGSTSEQLFRFMCDSTALSEPCIAYVAIGVFIVIWQILVGLLLIFGVMGFWVLLTEIFFLLGAGLYADEMNFQTLNIAMLTIALGYGMQRWLVLVCLGLLIVDVVGIGNIIEYCLFLIDIW